MAVRIIEIDTFANIPAYVPFGVVYYAQDTGALYIGTGSSTGPAVTLLGIGSTDPASSLSGYLQNDAGVGAAQNKIVMQDLAVPGTNNKRKALNVYLETAAQTVGSAYDGLQVNVGATISANTAASGTVVDAAEFFVSASGSGVTLPQINAVKARTTVTAGTSVSNVVAYLAFLPTIAGTITNYSGFELDSPGAGAGTVTTWIGVNCNLNLNSITVQNSYGAVFGGGNTATGFSAAIFLNGSDVNSGAIVWGTLVGSAPSNGIYSGTGSPNGVVTASPGSMYLNRSGGANTTLYIKESGSATNTGWVAK